MTSIFTITALLSFVSETVNNPGHWGNWVATFCFVLFYNGATSNCLKYIRHSPLMKTYMICLIISTVIVYLPIYVSLMIRSDLINLVPIVSGHVMSIMFLSVLRNFSNYTSVRTDEEVGTPEN